jgi:toxin ParE1/3/4
MSVEVLYVVLYETMTDTDEGNVHSVEIVRVADSHRDLAALF